MKILVSLFISVISSLAFAQDRVGNGGDVILCLEKDQIKKVELLDFYEDSKDLIVSDKKYEEIVQDRLDVLQKKDVSLSSQYAKRWNKMKKEIEFKEDVELVDIKDSNHVFEPSDKHCQLKQIAIRRKNIFGRQARFVVNKKYFDHLSSVHQAGLIWHEMVYEHYVKLGEKDSAKARAFNVALFSKDIETQSKEDFWKFIQSLKVPIYKK